MLRNYERVSCCSLVSMDVLLDLVRATRRRGACPDAEFTSPWCVSSDVGPEDDGAFLPLPRTPPRITTSRKAARR